MADQSEIKEAVRKRYAQIAEQAQQGATSCCASDCCSPAACGGEDVISVGLYGMEEAAEVPEKALLASLGCGNPVARAELRQNEVVLDLGSGGGIDVILSAKRVGPAGKAYGLDMTEEMLALAKDNASKAGVANAEFLKGEMEDIPLPDNSVDVIISNCVVNLSPDKAAVFREAYRVLRPGGRIAIADIVVRGKMPAGLKRSLELWAGCVAGALQEDEYRQKLAQAGFIDIEIEAVREYTSADVEGAGLGELRQQANPPQGLGLVSAMVRARRPINAI